MGFNLASWRPSRLLLAWCGYWLALLLVFLGPAMPTLFRVTRPDAHGSINVNLGSAGFQFDVIQDGVTVLTRSISVTALSLWLAVPPLLLWVLWLRAQRDTHSAAAERAV